MKLLNALFLVLSSALITTTSNAHDHVGVTWHIHTTCDEARPCGGPCTAGEWEWITGTFIPRKLEKIIKRIFGVDTGFSVNMGSFNGTFDDAAGSRRLEGEGYGTCMDGSGAECCDEFCFDLGYNEGSVCHSKCDDTNYCDDCCCPDGIPEQCQETECYVNGGVSRRRLGQYLRHLSSDPIIAEEIKAAVSFESSKELRERIAQLPKDKFECIGSSVSIRIEFYKLSSTR